MSREGPAVTSSVKDALATVRLAREHGNAINAKLVEDLSAAFREFELRRDVRGVLLTSAGRLFCPGLDLQELLGYDRQAMHRFMERFGACLLRIFECPKPVVAAIRGHALAGGCILALTADWRLLMEDAMVGLNEVKVGVPLPFGVSLILHEAVRTPHTEEVALRGRNYSGAEAIDAGLVHEVHGEEGFERRALERLAELAAKDPKAYSLTKRYLRSGTVERIRAQDALFRDEFLDCWFSAETRARIEGIVAELQTRRR